MSKGTKFRASILLAACTILGCVAASVVRAQPGESVTEIAMQWGFTHMGRFSIEYRRRFGESPSETLSRAACSPLYSPNRPPTSFSDFRAAWWKARRSG